MQNRRNLRLLNINIKKKKKIKKKLDKNRLRPLDADLQVPDTSKFKKHTKWKPKFTFQKR